MAGRDRVGGPSTTQVLAALTPLPIGGTLLALAALDAHRHTHRAQRGHTTLHYLQPSHCHCRHCHFHGGGWLLVLSPVVLSD
ncbi:hypothetical protein V6N13_024101 [Hibiscus sabdariffa]